MVDSTSSTTASSLPGSDDDQARPSNQASFPATRGLLRHLDHLGLAIVAAVAVGLRFHTTSPMWLDEALTVHIASQPVGQIPSALRHDGHPPLYYLLLHYWMSLFGTTNAAIRTLPGIFGALVIPASWAVARRIGGRELAWCAALFVAVAPFAIRYSTENRMYSLLMLLALLGWLCADSLIRRPGPIAAVGLVACTSAMLWSQYWGLWLGTTAALMFIGMLVIDRLHGREDRKKGLLVALGSLAVGALTFVPWVPIMLYQSSHTGTPWARRSLPPTVMATTVSALGGASNTTGQVAGWIFSLVIVIGAFGVGVGSGRILLDFRTQPRARGLATVAMGTVVIGCAVMLVTNTAYQPRYNAVWIPFAFLLGGLGLSVIRGPILQRAVIVVVVLASVPGNYQNVHLARTQNALIAQAIEHNGSRGDIVGVCPDQLGPSLTRVLTAGFDVGSYPTFSDPHTVDWVDYIARTHAATPTQFADNLMHRAGGRHRIFLVWSDRYSTHKTLCTQVMQILAARIPDNRELVSASYKYFEAANLTIFSPPSS